ncbi:MAG: UDP-N-acetylglucosamine--N-acetylmuramyl-(pentapeptide) pyrophosphoryl-undecaprenol N-acetylglucosamine transferase [Deferribacterota bacterium]|nr:UDP-N-acetylglucosamine--N-acetylmuramyl-(pentapeptide) pyrophosphoryl-undecaprenol N-acetylglucosamine transferase [Deferribacterota bacterium]
MRMIFAGGGTAGHIVPATIIAETLRKKGVDILFLVSNRGIERKLLQDKGFEFYEQNIKPYKNTTLVNRALSFFTIISSLFKVFFILKKSNKVLLLGGYASFPAGVVSIIKGCELYIYEQNSVMGLTNRLFAPFAKKVFTSFKETEKAKGNVVYVGYPIREEFKLIKLKDRISRNILVLGGSQGSRFINKLIVSNALILLEKGYYITHQTGEALYSETMELYRKENLQNIKALNVIPFYNNMVSLYNWADIVIARAGAGSVFETIASKRPAIFIPLEIAANNHQYKNALYAEKFGAFYILNAKMLTQRPS